MRRSGAYGGAGYMCFCASRERPVSVDLYMVHSESARTKRFLRRPIYKLRVSQRTQSIAQRIHSLVGKPLAHELQTPRLTLAGVVKFHPGALLVRRDDNRTKAEAIAVVFNLSKPLWD